MLETYFVKPQTVDRIRACWIGAEIERYVGWLAEHGYRARSVLRRVPVLVAFGEFARRRGASAPGGPARSCRWFRRRAGGRVPPRPGGR